LNNTSALVSPFSAFSIATLVWFTSTF
jgi:hypothetical protein